MVEIDHNKKRWWHVHFTSFHNRFQIYIAGKDERKQSLLIESLKNFIMVNCIVHICDYLGYLCFAKKMLPQKRFVLHRRSCGKISTPWQDAKFLSTK